MDLKRAIDLQKEDSRENVGFKVIKPVRVKEEVIDENDE